MPDIVSSGSSITDWRFDEGDLVRDKRCECRERRGTPVLGLVYQIFVDIGDTNRLAMVRVMWSTGVSESLIGEAIDNALERVRAAVRLKPES